MLAGGRLTTFQRARLVRAVRIAVMLKPDTVVCVLGEKLVSKSFAITCGS
jgi:hypothetical protein